MTSATLPRVIGSAFLQGAFYTVPSLLIAANYFPEQALLASAALIAIALAGTMQNFLEENRVAIWEIKAPPFQANTRLALQFTGLCIGVFFVALIFFFTSWLELVSVNHSLQHVFTNTLLPLIEHNFTVLVAVSVFALIYRSGALMLLLAWQALNWASSVSYYFGSVSEAHGILAGLLILTALLPHLILESTAFVLAGLTGVFVSKAISKYKVSSDEFYQVSRAALVVLVFALLLLALAATTEIYLAQRVFEHYRP